MKGNNGGEYAESMSFSDNVSNINLNVDEMSKNIVKSVEEAAHSLTLSVTEVMNFILNSQIDKLCILAASVRSN